MYRLTYFVYRAVTAARHWLLRRFTPAGLAVLAGSVIMGVVGIDPSQNVAHQVSMFLVALLAVALLSSVGFRARFRVERVLPKFSSVGGTLPYRIIIHNQTPRPQRGLKLLENLVDPRPNLEGFIAQLRSEKAQRGAFRRAIRPNHRRLTVATIKPGPVPALPPHGTGEVKLELLPLKRGVLRLTGLTLARSDPLGLFQAFQTLTLPQSVLILPKRYFLPPIALPGMMKYQQGGVAQASSVGESEEFISLREYRPGDPLRHIHWKSWAKLRKPIVREFADEFFVRHALILDTFEAAAESEAFEEAVSLAASFACTIRTQESLLDLMFVGPQAFCFTAGRGLAHSEQMLEILASVRLCREHPFRMLQRLVLNHIAVVSGCIVILLAWDAVRRELIKQLESFGVPMLVLVVVEPGQQARSEAAAKATATPARFHVLEAGRIAEGLAAL